MITVMQKAQRQAAKLGHAVYLAPTGRHRPYYLISDEPRDDCLYRVEPDGNVSQFQSQSIGPLSDAVAEKET